MPCGEVFATDIIAGEHYLKCGECDHLHKERNFEGS